MVGECLRVLIWQLQVLNASEDQLTNGRGETCLSVSSGPLYSCFSAEGNTNNWITAELCCFTKLCEQVFVTSVGCGSDNGGLGSSPKLLYEEEAI